MRINKLLAGAALVLVGAPGIAFAQDEAAVESSDEVVVVARQREERLQDVPIAVTAVSADQLEREGVLSVREAAAFAPGLNISSDAVGRAFMSIRGVGTTLIDTVQPGVGIFIDGIYQPNTSYLNNPVLDVSRIEVLKGPQGTLFGNNTLGGAINVITRQPTDDFTGRFVADYADPDNYHSVSGSLSGPIIEGVLRGRVAASYHSQDGFSENTLAGGNARPIESQAVNGTLVWDAPDNARLTLNAYYNEIEGSQTAYSSPSGPTDYIQDTALNFNSIANYTYTGGNIRGVFDITDNTQMTAILAYDHKEGEAIGDGDFGPVPFAHVINGRNEMNTYTGELRFDTRWNDRVSTLIGVFANASDVRNSDTTVLTVPNPGVPPPDFIDVPVPSSESQDLTSQAIYANIFYNLTETLELSAGVRYDHQEVHAENDLSGETTNYEASEVQPRVALTQHWSPDHMSYISIARGFRGGGANSFGAPNPIYQGDSVWTYEIGDKFQTSDRTFTLNTAIYFNDYQHYIGQNSLTPSLIAVNLNTGDVTAYGAEIEGVWSPNEMFTLQGGLTYNHARIDNDDEYFAVIGDHLPSDRILFQPDWNMYLTPTLVFPVGNGGDDIRFNVTAIYKGERVGSSLDPNVAPMLEGYTLVNANLAYEHENWTFALWGTNLTDEEYYDSYLDRSLLGALFGDASPITRNLGIMGDGRRVGVRVAARF